MKKRLLATTLLILLSLAGKTQEGYTLKKPAVWYTSGIGLALSAGGIYAQYNIQPLTPAAINGLNTDGFGPLDLQATRNHSTAAKTWSDISVVTLMAAPGFFSLAGKPREQFFTCNTVYAQTLLATAGQVALIKALVLKERPYVYNTNVPLEEKTERKARFSIPSGHTALSAAACYFFASSYSIYYPKSKWKPLVWACAAVLPAIPAYLRFKAGRHFVSDVAAGYLIGAANGIVIPMIFRIRN
ncbi:MAG TPA: phosphatase PAP2 family protein [Bacteroidia bacterium]|nr:phosphatase PAP2 family protein [Bacteroidia bacterium]